MDPWLTVRRNRPRYGLSPKYFYKIIGKKSKRNIGFGDPIKLSDL
jgi:sialic acid synthase SpsE